MIAKTFTSRPGAARGLQARPILADSLTMYLADVASISYTVTNLTDGGSPVTGTLTPADVMFDTKQIPWTEDRIGYTFLWQAPGSLWPTASKQYHIDVHLVGTDGCTYKHAWVVTTDER
jgi:hypothetical protein